MARVYKNRIKENTATSGTGVLTLSGAVSGFQSFAAIGDGNTCNYVIEDANGVDWEVGIGTYSAAGPSLSRDTILDSSNAGATISLSIGNHAVFCTATADDLNEMVRDSDIGSTVAAHSHGHTISDVTSLQDTIDVLSGAIENGFVDRAQSVISFDNATRTFSIAPDTPTYSEYEFYAGGNRFLKTTTETLVIPNIEGLHYVYFDTSGTVQVTQVFDIEAIIVENAFVSVVYWDATNNEAIIVGDERHGRMDAQTHKYLHEALGSQFVSGLGLSNITADQSGNDPTHAQIAVNNGVIRDEDIRFEITNASPQALALPAQIPLYYRSGATGLWRKLTATTYPVTTTGTGRAAWNEWTGATWQLSEVPNNDYVLTHLFATTNTLSPVIGLVGQTSYSSAANAREGALTELTTLLLGALETLSPEWVPIATLIFQTADNKSNAVKSSIESTDGGDSYIDWRDATLAGTGGASVTSLGDLGITATATELNYVDGVTSSIQTQLDGKAASDHDHTGVYEPADATILKDADIGVTVAAQSHDHAISDVTGLQTALDGKAASDHNHDGIYEPADATILKDADIGVTVAAQGHDHAGVYEPADATILKDADVGVTVAAQSHDHAGVYEPADATILKDADIGVTVAAEGHDHAISDVTGLQTALDGKLAASSYTAGDVLTKIKTVDGSGSGLDADALDGQEGSYYLNWTNVTNKPNPNITLAGDASGNCTLTDLGNATLTVTVLDDSHNHTIANVDGLQAALDGKAASSHTHAYDNYGSWTAQDGDTTTYTVTSGDTLQFAEGAGMDVNFTADDVLTFTNTDRGSSQAIFKNVAVSGQSTIVADANNDTLTIAAGNNVTITTDAATDTLTIASTDTNTTYSAGNGLTLSGTQFSHTDTSTQASVNNANGTVIQDVTLDTYGHVTGLASVDLDSRYARTYTGTKTLSTTAGNYVELFSLNRANGAHSFLLHTTVSDSAFSVSKFFWVTTKYNSPNSWQILRPASDSGPYGNDYRIEVYSNAVTTSVRAVRTAGTTAGTLTFEVWEGHDALASTYTELSGTGASTATVVYNELDADLLDGQEGSYYLNATNLNAGTINDARLPATISSDITGSSASCTGNAATATKLQTARNIALSGDVTGNANFDGSANITITATVADDSHNHTIANVDGLQTTLDGKAASSHTHTSSEITDATSANTANTIVERDASGNFSAGTITADLSGNASTASGLATARNIALSGDVTGSVNFDGSTNVTITATVADDSHNHTIANVDGLQTALDAKLAASSYTAADVLAKVKTVDGSGSDLDADKLDGLHASSFVRSDATDTISGEITFTNTPIISGASPTLKFDDSDGYDHWIHVNSNSFYVLTDRDGNGSWESPHPLTLASHTNTGYLYGNRILTVADEGAGNGLDADLLDGLHASSFMQLSASQTKTTGIHSYRSADVMETATGDQATLEVYQDTVGADAFMQFHIPGDFAAYFGLKGDINDFAVGGWSMGNTYHRVWHAGNDGPGSGLDADTLDGYQPSISASNNTIVQRTSAGYIYANYFNTSPNDVGSGVTKVCVETGNDGFIRHGTAAAIAEFLSAWPTFNVGDSSVSTASTSIQCGNGRTGNGFAYLDLVGDTTYTDYGLRIIRNNGGANTTSEIAHRGTGAFLIKAIDASRLEFHTSGSERFRISSGGSAYLYSGSLYFPTDNNGIIMGLAHEASINFSGSAMTFNNEGNRMNLTTGSLNFVTGVHALWGKTSSSIATNGVEVLNFSGGGAIFATRESSATAHFNRRGTDGGVVLFYNDGTNVGSVSVSGSSTAYNTSSDERLKTNIEYAADAGPVVDALQVRQFDWKSDGKHQRYGLIAQEAHPFYPECVSVGDEESEMWSVDYSKLTPLLLKEIQSLRARVAQLETLH